MALFNIGDKVVHADNELHGIITGIRTGRGRVLYTVFFPNGESSVLEPDLRPDCDLSDPFERCKGGIFGSYSDYTRKNTTFKINNSNNSTISSLKASKTIFRSYQFKPLLKFLNSPNRRLLVADEVGLGKTIEAGHIMMELKARNELKNVLIICPKSLQNKWKAELFEKFGLSFKIVESSQELINDIESHIGFVRAIINYEKIRSKKSGDKKRNREGLVEYLSENATRFSLVLCDEAHKMRNRETQTYKGAEVIMECADAAIFLTATPIMINDGELFNLLHLLDNARYYNYDIFKNRMNENKPFVEAIFRLNKNEPLQEVLKNLMESSVHYNFYSNDREIFSATRTIGEIYEGDPILEEIVNLCNAEDSHRVRARLQYLFSSMSMMNSVFSRTRKREVTTDMSQAERKPHLRKIVLTDEEQEEFDTVINEYTDDNSYTDFWGDERLTQGGALGLVQRKRQIASSVWAYLNSEADLDKGIDSYRDYQDSKFNELIRILKRVFENGNKKIVVFTLFRKTIKYLKIRLSRMGYNCVVIHGGIENRAQVLHRFKVDNNIHVLLSSEVGSEGLDMQFCNSMVNYDLPWNPMVVEQRIGRLDRFGQKSPVINIYNFVVANSIQEEIYVRLLDRIGIFRGNIGDMEAILDAEMDFNGNRMTIQEAYNKMEKEFFTKDISEEERDRKMAEIERATANEQENLQQIQEGLNNTLTNDAYFNEEISRIIKKKSYVTSKELENFIKALIFHHLTTCNLEDIGEGVFEFSMSLSQPTILSNFLTRYSRFDDESRISVNQFKNRISNERKFKLTFNQKVAYDNPSLFFLNIYHPLIQSCLNYFLKNDDASKTSFSYSLKADDILLAGNRFYMGVYQITISKMVHNVKKNTTELIPLVFSPQTNEMIRDEVIINRIYSRSQSEGQDHNASNKDIAPDIIDNMNYDFTDHISKIVKKRIEEENRQIESDRRRNEQQTIEYYTSRKASYEQSIQDAQDDMMWIYDKRERLSLSRRIQLAKNQIKSLEKECKEKLAQINENNNLTIDDKILSLSLITIL